jgi:hypothetical protein
MELGCEMIISLYRSLVVVMLLLPFVPGLSVTSAQENPPLLYVTDYNHMNDYYIELDITTGETQRFERAPDFQGIRYSGERRLPERQEIVSPYDESVRFMLLRDFDAPNRDEEEQLLRVREDEQLEPVLSGEDIYLWEDFFTDNGRYAYLFKRTENGMQYVLYTLYRYDIQSGELDVVTGRVPGAGLDCQEGWCQFIRGMPNSEDDPQTVLILNKNSGELRELETAEEITVHYWWEGELLYSVYDGGGQAAIKTYRIESNQYRTLTEIAGRGIVRAARVDDWMIVVANSLEKDHIFDLYIVNDLASNPATYPLGIETSNANVQTKLFGEKLLAIIHSPEDEWESDLYILSDITTQPTVEQLPPTDFGLMTLQNVSLAFPDLGDTQLLHVGVNSSEWRYYTIHVLTRTITQVTAFKSGQEVVQTLVSADNKWLAVSIAESGQYYVRVVPVDGSQPFQNWDVGMESYVCLLIWGEPGIEPPACTLYFGIG